MVKSKFIKMIIAAILISQCSFSMIACKDKSIDSKTSSVKDTQAINLNENYGVIYEYTKDINYKIYSSQFIDTYIIATALYNDFKCNNIMPNLEQHQIYIKAKGVFNSESELNEFLTLFKNFYSDTKADKFFKENSAIYSEMNDYVKNNIEKSNVIRIISFQSPNDFSRNPKTFDINQMISSTIHEFLHGFINIAVENNNNFINELAVGKDKKSFASPMYQNMPWNRIVDENFVRAVQGQIYKNIFNEERANNEILDKEIKFGGFTKLKGVYDKLNYYDKNREAYVMIDDFIPELIKELFSI